MTQGEFEKLTQKYLKGECSSAEKALLESWTEEQLSSSKFKDENLANGEGIQAEMWQSLQQELNLFPSRKRLILWRWLSIAAGVLLMLGGVTMYHQVQIPSLNKGAQIQNLGKDQQSITLPDGSIVILGQEAKLTTQRDFGKSNRQVNLEGEAFFKVKPNAKLPFLIQTGGLMVEVLGTSFHIKPNEQNRDIEVAVKTGRVSVYTNAKGSKTGNGVTLSPNQKVIFDADTRTLQEGIVATPERLETPINPARLQFDEAYLEEILVLLRQDFGVEIIVNDPVMKQCTFTGDLNELDLFQQLEILCNTIDASYTVRGAVIFISGQGCN
jgi:transmembrane sensor